MRVSGQEGVIRWGYHPAATLRQWAIADSTLTATVVQSDAFRVSQRPLTFVAPVQGGAWRWAVTTLQITGSTLTATIGPKES